MGTSLVLALIAFAGTGWLVLHPDVHAVAARRAQRGQKQEALDPHSPAIGASSSTSAQDAAEASSSLGGPIAWPAFAQVAGLRLIIPSQRFDAVAFHEATYADAMELEPLGRMTHNFNRTKFDPPPDSPGVPYLVETSRGRTNAATSAADVVLPRTATVLAPVTGTVMVAKRYKLYGQYPDIRVEIKPEGFPDLRVVIIHLDDVAVARGDEVSATLTAIGRPRAFPFASVVNDEVASDDPHIHIEVKEPDATSNK